MLVIVLMNTEKFKNRNIRMQHIEKSTNMNNLGNNLCSIMYYITEIGYVKCYAFYIFILKNYI